MYVGLTAHHHTNTPTTGPFSSIHVVVLSDHPHPPSTTPTKPQVKEGSISLLGELVSDALVKAATPGDGGAKMRAAVAKMLPDVILRLIESLSDTRPAVKQAALRVFPEVRRGVGWMDGWMDGVGVMSWGVVWLE